MTILRSPRTHVLSQYFECASSDDWIFAAKGQVERIPKTFQEYVRSWALWQEQGNVSGYWEYSSDVLECYRPISLQAMRYTCAGPFIWPASINSTEAVANMMDTEYVGIVEAYQESLCLFHAKLTGALPSFCDCSNATAWASYQHQSESHGETPHSLTDYAADVIADIDTLTHADRILYMAAVKRFEEDVRGVETHFGTKILCRNLEDDPALQYVLAPLKGGGAQHSS
jgi:hypothetical protein